MLTYVLGLNDTVVQFGPTLYFITHCTFIWNIHEH